jgi:hypothetical protein
LEKIYVGNPQTIPMISIISLAILIAIIILLSILWGGGKIALVGKSR